MYEPLHFQHHGLKDCLSLIQSYPLAQLARVQDGVLCSDPIPLRFRSTGEAGGVLVGHVARANPLGSLSDRCDVLVTFTGPQAYISPSLYATKAEHHKVVPTWNYAMVQVHGRMRCITDPTWLIGVLNEMTDQMEQPRQAPWSVKDAPAGFVDTMLVAIVGIEIEVLSMRGKWKMSQNQPEKNRQSVVQGLQGEGNEASAVAEWVEYFRGSRP